MFRQTLSTLLLVCAACKSQPAAPAANSATGASTSAATTAAPVDVATRWLQALGASDTAQLAKLTHMPFVQRGGTEQFTACGRLADVAAFTGCLVKDTLTIDAVGHAGIGTMTRVMEVSDAGPPEYLDFAKDAYVAPLLKELPSGRRVYTVIAGDGQTLSWVLVVDHDQVVGGVFTGEAVE